MSGYFITFEGGEGSGKTTQIALLREKLAAQGLNVLVTREPGGTPLGDSVRALLMDRRSQIVPTAEVLLFSASRAQLVEEVIRPHLDGGGIVICDRYADSTYAYQGYGRGLDLAVLRQLTRITTGGLIPDLTVYLAIEAAIGLARRDKAGDLTRLDALDLSFHQRVQDGYKALIAESPQRWAMVDADQPTEQVFAAVWEIVRARLKLA